MYTKAFFGFLSLFCWVMPSACQAQFSVGGEAGVALPFGTLGNQVNIGFGGQGNVSYFLTKNFSLGLGVGYHTFSGNSQVSFEGYHVNITPIVAKADLYFTDADFQPFIGIEAGFYRLASRYQVNNTTQVLGESYWGLSPKVGVMVHTTPSFKLLGNIKYNHISTDIASNNYLTINLGAIYLWYASKKK